MVEAPHGNSLPPARSQLDPLPLLAGVVKRLSCVYAVTCSGTKEARGCAMIWYGSMDFVSDEMKSTESAG